MTDDAVIQQRMNHFFKCAYGIPGPYLCRALNQRTHGINWLGCSKGHLAECYGGLFADYGSGISRWTPEQLEEVVNEARKKFKVNTERRMQKL